ncbi:MAG: hypothetical protein KJ908_10705 [Acidobacteria bacterium]|nr:hypothetical protein [Acidobacteriota bacterium]MBU1475368.1 hypothetical protein [Acidobacteriota bacterium]
MMGKVVFIVLMTGLISFSFAQEKIQLNELNSPTTIGERSEVSIKPKLNPLKKERISLIFIRLLTPAVLPTDSSMSSLMNQSDMSLFV